MVIYKIIHRDKVTSIVRCPTKSMDTVPLVAGRIDSEKSSTYDLSATSSYMEGLGGGHYTLICQELHNQKTIHL